jgi:hypothetical protein
MVNALGGYSNALLAFAGVFVAGLVTVSLTNEKEKN